MRTYLISATDWRRESFLSRPPCQRTVVRWCETGKLPAQKIGGTWFVICDGMGRPATAQASTGNPGADALLAEWAKSA